MLNGLNFALKLSRFNSFEHIAKARTGLEAGIDQVAAGKKTRGPKLLLAERGYDPVFGARPLKRVIQRELGDRLAVSLLDGTFSEGSVVHVDVEAGDFVLR